MVRRVSIADYGFRYVPLCRSPALSVGGLGGVDAVRTPSTTVAVNPHARCHTLLFCTLFCSPRFRALRQRETLGPDRLRWITDLEAEEIRARLERSST
jgi:hypothetical protein